MITSILFYFSNFSNEVGMPNFLKEIPSPLHCLFAVIVGHRLISEASYFIQFVHSIITNLQNEIKKFQLFC